MEYRMLATACVALYFSLSPLHAEAQQECLSLWKTADIDANGVLVQAEDNDGYIATATNGGHALKQSNALSRDEFLQLCADNVFAAGPGTAAAPGPAAGRDMGKGDLTPAQNPLSEGDARNKLEASGFREVQDLKLDKNSIWRGTALANGERQSVAIDAQGDIVAKSETSPAMADPSAARKDVQKDTAVATSAGSAGTGGLILWSFLLIGNALAVMLLSVITAGGTSAMSSRTDASAFA